MPIRAFVKRSEQANTPTPAAAAPAPAPTRRAFGYNLRPAPAPVDTTIRSALPGQPLQTTTPMQSMMFQPLGATASTPGLSVPFTNNAGRINLGGDLTVNGARPSGLGVLDSSGLDVKGALSRLTQMEMMPAPQAQAGLPGMSGSGSGMQISRTDNLTVGETGGTGSNALFPEQADEQYRKSATDLSDLDKFTLGLARASDPTIMSFLSSDSDVQFDNNDFFTGLGAGVGILINAPIQMIKAPGSYGTEGIRKSIEQNDAPIPLAILRGLGYGAADMAYDTGAFAIGEAKSLIDGTLWKQFQTSPIEALARVAVDVYAARAAYLGVKATVKPYLTEPMMKATGFGNWELITRDVVYKIQNAKPGEVVGFTPAEAQVYKLLDNRIKRKIANVNNPTPMEARTVTSSMFNGVKDNPIAKGVARVFGIKDQIVKGTEVMSAQTRGTSIPVPAVPEAPRSLGTGAVTNPDAAPGVPSEILKNVINDTKATPAQKLQELIDREKVYDLSPDQIVQVNQYKSLLQDLIKKEEEIKRISNAKPSTKADQSLIDSVVGKLDKDEALAKTFTVEKFIDQTTKTYKMAEDPDDMPGLGKRVIEDVSMKVSDILKDMEWEQAFKRSVEGNTAIENSLAKAEEYSREFAKLNPTIYFGGARSFTIPVLPVQTQPDSKNQAPTSPQEAVSAPSGTSGHPEVQSAQPAPTIKEETTFYRGGGHGSMPKGMTAADIINYERDELGNADITVEPGIEIEWLKADSLIWLTESKDAAAEYGDVEPVKISNYKIVARDGQGGVLVWPVKTPATGTNQRTADQIAADQKQKDAVEKLEQENGQILSKARLYDTAASRVRQGRSTQAEFNDLQAKGMLSTEEEYQQAQEIRKQIQAIKDTPVGSLVQSGEKSPVPSEKSPAKPYDPAKEILAATQEPTTSPTTKPTTSDPEKTMTIGELPFLDPVEYADVADIPVEFNAETPSAQIVLAKYEDENGIVVSQEVVKIWLNPMLDDKEAKISMIHEIQHARDVRAGIILEPEFTPEQKDWLLTPEGRTAVNMEKAKMPAGTPIEDVAMKVLHDRYEATPQEVRARQAVEDAKAKDEVLYKSHKVGDLHSIGGIPSELVRLESYDGVDYELWDSAGLDSTVATIRVYDTGAGEFVTIQKYKDFDKAEEVYNTETKILKKMDAPAKKPEWGNPEDIKKAQVSAKAGEILDAKKAKENAASAQDMATRTSLPGFGAEIRTGQQSIFDVKPDLEVVATAVEKDGKSLTTEEQSDYLRFTLQDMVNKEITAMIPELENATVGERIIAGEQDGYVKNGTWIGVKAVFPSWYYQLPYTPARADIINIMQNEDSDSMIRDKLKEIAHDRLLNGSEEKTGFGKIPADENYKAVFEEFSKTNAPDTAQRTADQDSEQHNQKPELVNAPPVKTPSFTEKVKAGDRSAVIPKVSEVTVDGVTLEKFENSTVKIMDETLMTTSAGIRVAGRFVDLGLGVGSRIGFVHKSNTGAWMVADYETGIAYGGNKTRTEALETARKLIINGWQNFPIIIQGSRKVNELPASMMIEKPQGSIIQPKAETIKPEVLDGQSADAGAGSSDNAGEVPDAQRLGSADTGRTNPVNGEPPVRGEPQGSAVSIIDAGDGSGGRKSGTAVIHPTRRTVKKTATSRLALNQQVEEIIHSKGNEERFDPAAYDEAEKRILSQYSGYGGIREREDGQVDGALDEFFTPSKLVRFTYKKLIDIMGADALAKVEYVVEPAIGTGNFVAFSPLADTKFHGYEINTYSAVVSKVLNPGMVMETKEKQKKTDYYSYHPIYETIPQGFQEQFIQDNTGGHLPEPYADLVVGNPPYGKYIGEAKGMGEGTEFGTFIEYFIGRGLAILKDGGHLAYVVDSRFLRGASSKGKEAIARLGEFVGSYRFPNGAFGETGTDVGTDLVIFKRIPTEDSLVISGRVARMSNISDEVMMQKTPENIFGEPGVRSGRFGEEPFVKGSMADIPTVDNEDFVEVRSHPSNVTSKAKIIIQKPMEPAPMLDDDSFKKIETKLKLNHKVKYKMMDIGNSIDEDPTVMSAYREIQYDGTLPQSFIKGLAPEEQVKSFSFHQGKWKLDDFYLENQNLYTLLEDLETDHDFISDEQYEKQAKYIEDHLPRWIEAKNINVHPTSELWKNIQTANGVSVRDEFLSRLRSYPADMFEGIGIGTTISYVSGENLTQGKMTDEERHFIRNNASRIAVKLFRYYLSQIDTDPATKKIIEDDFNKQKNAYVFVSHKDMPMETKVNKDFAKNFELNSAQHEAIGFLLARGKGIAALDVGVGKTLTAVIATQELFNRGWAKRAALIAPNPTVGAQWINTIKRIFPEATIYDFRDSKNIASFAGRKLDERSFTVMTQKGMDKLSLTDDSYFELIDELTEAMGGEELTPRERDQFIEKVKELIGQAKMGTSPVTLEELGIDHLVMDEAHNYNHVIEGVPKKLDKKTGKPIRNPYTELQMNRSKRGLKMFIMAKHILKHNNNRNVFLMTATPFANNPLEQYTLFSMVAAQEMKDRGVYNVREFTDTFFEMEMLRVVKPSGNIDFASVVTKFKNFDVYRQMVGSSMLKIDGEDAGVIRPEKHNNEVYLNPSELQLNQGLQLSARYNELTKELKKLNRYDAEAAARAKKLNGERLSCSQAMIANSFSQYAGTAYTGDKPTPKEFGDNTPVVRATALAIKERHKQNPQARVIIYIGNLQNKSLGLNFHHATRDYLIQEFGYKAEEIGLINGSVSQAKRVQMQDAFNKGKVKIMIGTYAMAEGVDLQKRTTDIFVLTPMWNYTNYKQLAGRAWRQGNENKHLMYNLMLTKNTGAVFVAQKNAQKERREKELNKAVKRGEQVMEVEGDEVSFDEVLASLMTDPVQRVEIERKMEEESIKIDLAGLSGRLATLEDLWQGISVKNLEYLIREDEAQIESNQRRIAEAKQFMKDWPDDAKKQEQYTKQIAANHKNIASKRVSITNIKSRIETLARQKEQEGVTQEMIDALKAKIEEKRKAKDNISAKFAEKEKQAIEDRKNMKYEENDYKAITQEYLERSAGLFPRVSVFPKIAAGTSASFGGSRMASYEPREKQLENKKFLMRDKVVGLIDKYAQSIGEGFLPYRAAGIYNQRTKNIRVQSVNNLSVAAHEITHFLDHAYDISKPMLATIGENAKGNPIYAPETAPFRKEMTSLYETYYPGGSKKHSLKKRMVEGFATLLQKYVETPSNIELLYPTLVKEFLQEGGKYYKPIMGEILKDLNDIVAEYQALDEMAELAAVMVSNEKEDVVDKESFLSLHEKLRTELADGLFPLEVVDQDLNIFNTKKSSYLAMTQARNYKAIVANNLFSDRGYYAWRNGEFVKVHKFNWKTLIDNLREDKTLDTFGYYLVARRQHFDYLELDELAQKIIDIQAAYDNMATSLVKNDGVAEADVAKEIRKLKNADGLSLDEELEQAINDRAELAQVLEQDGFVREKMTNVYEHNKAQYAQDEKMYDTLVAEDLDFLAAPEIQLVKKKKRDELKKKQGYATYKREVEDQIVGEANGSSAIKVGKTKVSSMMRRTGSEKSIYNPIYGAILNHSEIIKKGLQQAVYNRIGDIAMTGGLPLLFENGTLEVHRDEKSGRLSYPQERDPHIIMARIKEKRVPILVDAQIKFIIDNALTYKHMHIFEQLLVTAAKMFTLGTTGFYWIFPVTNVPQDQITAAVNSSHKFIPLISPLKTLWDMVWKKDPVTQKYWTEYIELAGMRQTMVGSVAMSPVRLFSAINQEKNAIEKVIDLVSKGLDLMAMPSSASEIITRITEYINSRKAGDTQAAALEKAARVSGSFSHIGLLSNRMFNKKSQRLSGEAWWKMNAFSNTGFQILDGTLRALEGADGGSGKPPGNILGWQSSGFGKNRRFKLTPGGRRVYFAVLATMAVMIASIAYLKQYASEEQKQQWLDLYPEDLTKFVYFPNFGGSGLTRIRVSETFSSLAAVVNMLIGEQILGADYTTNDYITAGTSWLPQQFNPLLPMKWFLSIWPTTVMNVLTPMLGVKTYPEVRALESIGQSRLPPSDRMNEDTSWMAKQISKIPLMDGKNLGDTLNMSPLKIDALITGTLGRASGYATGKPSMWKASNPFEREYYFTMGRRVGVMYDVVSAVDQQYNRYQHGKITLSSDQVRDLYRKKQIGDAFSESMSDFRKLDIEQTPEKKVVKQREDIIKLIDMMESDKVLPGFSDKRTTYWKNRRKNLQEL